MYTSHATPLNAKPILKDIYDHSVLLDTVLKPSLIRPFDLTQLHWPVTSCASLVFP